VLGAEMSRRKAGRYIALLVLFLIVASAVLTTSTPGNTDVSKLEPHVAEFIENHKNKTYWYGLYAETRKVGYASTTLNYNLEAKSVITYNYNVLLKLKTDDSETKYKFNETQNFDGNTGNFLTCESEEISPGDEVDLRIKGTVSNNKIVLKSSSGQETSLKIPDTGYNIKDLLFNETWVLTKPEIADTAIYEYLECGEQRFVKSSGRIIKKENTYNHGKSTTKYKISEKNKEGNLFFEISSYGNVINYKLGDLSLRSEAEKIAKDTESIDLFSYFFIPIDNPIKDIDKLKTLKLKITAKNTLNLKNMSQQRIGENTNSYTKLTLSYDANRTHKIPQEETKKYSRHTIYYPSKDEEIQKLANRIIDGAGSVEEKLRRILVYVNTLLIYDTDANSENVFQTLKTKRGDCSEYTRLFVTLARAVGIPSKEASGFIYTNDDENPGFGGHAWAQVAIDGVWIGIDPLWGEFPINPIRINIEGNLELLVSKTGIEILQKIYRKPYVSRILDKQIELAKTNFASGNLAKAVPALKILSSKGHRDGQYILGQHYLSLAGPEGDKRQAMEMFRLAGEQGHVAAQLALANIHSELGEDDHNARSSAYWLKKAANDGNREAAILLSEAYRNGGGVPQNIEEAEFWKVYADEITEK